MRELGVTERRREEVALERLAGSGQRHRPVLRSRLLDAIRDRPTKDVSLWGWPEGARRHEGG